MSKINQVNLINLSKQGLEREGEEYKMCKAKIGRLSNRLNHHHYYYNKPCGHQIETKPKTTKIDQFESRENDKGLTVIKLRQ